jgi:creatinine amidohydrolase
VRLDQATWLEVEEYLARSSGIIIPCGSTEQHGPMGIIGTDAICAEMIANRVGDNVGALVAPTLAYTPAPFNMSFPGTMSVPEPLFETLVSTLVDGLRAQDFKAVYFVNGHGANLAPLNRIRDKQDTINIRIRSWWDFSSVNELREKYYGEWEGMHATPSEVAITQATHRIIEPGLAATPPRKLTKDYILTHAGDRHGPPDRHRDDFPDGRVGSHSALADPAHGRELLDAAVAAVGEDYGAFLKT